jgi:pimeloyl-ACP methyl ester carboxylesterase
MVTCFNTVEGNIFELFTGTGDDTQMETMLSNCMTELNEGRDIAAHTTPENARDVQALMRTLGYTEWNLYGVSYGTKLAFDVMRSAPEGTKAVVIDSVAPPNSRSYDENMLPISEGIDAVVRPSAENAACNAAFPDFRATILRMADELHKSPSPANADDRR